MGSMLDVETKRRIDNARDILVGKVPDPKSQVEQITIALIYKFMDDADAESEELGGRRSFFAGEFAQYAWRNLVRSGLGGHEALALYKEALERMPQNPEIPRLFRDILAGAFLPYNDPETLRLFLKEIDGFRRERSDGFGDAYEHLLRALGAQGDAGQFLTPRHIIEFIVGIVDPQKHERVLDPACGTAGFLIAAYEHIRRANRGADGADLLTPAERGLIANNFAGYDISPDMARLSRVNMHLHGFLAPNIQEYDTLTSEDFWTQYADVILANPPFMSPKGGIRPHGRFSVQSKRSEVLFTDYIAEHLTAGGRAGIIVPEGVIFQSQGAHTQLRKMLVEKHLAAVVSLPAGVFQPYSGVKTSILILDNALARRTDRVAFFKVESDGFDLGAQRRPIARNDLPAVQRELREYLRLARAGDGLDGFAPAHGLVVEKSRLAAGGDFNLSIERYRETRRVEREYPMARVDEVCEINPRKTEIAHLDKSCNVSFLPMADIGENTMYITPARTEQLADVSSNSYTYCRDGDVLVAKVTPCLENGKGGIARNLENGIGFATSEVYVLRPSDSVLPEFLYLTAGTSRFREWATPQMTGTGGLQRVPKSVMASWRIPLPSLEAQHAIVGEIDGYQRVLDGARAVVEGWRPRIVVDPEWPLARLGDVCEVSSGNPAPQGAQYFDDGEFPFIRTADVGAVHLSVDFSSASADKVNQKAVDELRLRLSPKGTILFPKSGASTFLNHRVLLRDAALVSSHLACIACAGDSVIPEYMFYQLCEIDARDITPDQAYPSLRLTEIANLRIPLPSLDVQRAIVEEIEGERSLVDANRELMERMASRIAGAVGRAWGAGG